MEQEVELKLELPQGAVNAFIRADLLPSESDIADLRATYFDTPDRRLHAEGLSLRIRRSGAECIQTVKADKGNGKAGLFARAEWEMPVTGDAPVLDTRTPVAALLGDDVAAVAPAFEVEVERRRWQLANLGEKVELVLDQGLVRAGERQAQICEIELERKAGGAPWLFALARRIEAVVPVRLGVVAKAERGYHLLEAARPAFKAEPVRLRPGMRADEAFVAVASVCVRHYRLNEALLLDHYDPQSLHQARVAVRRLRSALTLFKPMLAKADVDRFQGELRWLAGVLGEARDLDVLVTRIEESALLADVEAARARVHDEVTDALETHRVRALMIDLMEWLTLGAGTVDADRQALREEAAERFAGQRLQHVYRRVIKGGRGMTKLDDEARHEVRKDAKKLRYATEFFAGLFVESRQRRRHAHFIEALEGLQDDLGALNDLVSTPHILAKHDLADAEGALSSRGRKKKLAAAAAETHESLAEAKRFWR